MCQNYPENLLKKHIKKTHKKNKKQTPISETSKKKTQTKNTNFGNHRKKHIRLPGLDALLFGLK